jgi:hypothetical protein
MALYFLVLFPEQTDCFTEKPAESEEKYFHPLFELYEDRTQAPFNPVQGQCTILLWYSVVMVLSLLVLVYYVYVVQVDSLVWNCCYKNMFNIFNRLLHYKHETLKGHLSVTNTHSDKDTLSA